MAVTTMRVLFINLCIIFVSLAVIHADGSSLLPDHQPTPPPTVLDKVKSPFLKNDQNAKGLVELMQKRFDNSLKYLYTSKQYGSQYVERPGMAKFLMDASDKQWEEGLDVLQKVLQRGGLITDGYFNLTVTGKGDLTFGSNEDINEKYVHTLKHVLKDSLHMSNLMNRIHQKSNKNPSDNGDAEIGHYLDGKLEVEAKRIREMAGHVVTLDKMNSLGVALNMFDSNL